VNVEDLTTVNIESTNLLDVAPCNLVDTYEYPEETHYFSLQETRGYCPEDGSI
jgi:hypothetical protein